MVVVTEIGKKSFKKMPAEQYDAALKKMRADDEKMKKGMFEFIDAQGGWLDFSYRFYPGEPLRTIRIVHGEICDLPMGIVRHLNNCHKKVRVLENNNPNLDQGKGRGIPTTVIRQSRMRFTPMDVM